jgi:hypothetical protein
MTPASAESPALRNTKRISHVKRTPLEAGQSWRIDCQPCGKGEWEMNAEQAVAFLERHKKHDLRMRREPL